MNEMIRVKEVRVIDADGQQIGVLPIEEALALAQDRNLDLVEVAPNTKPPVCKVMDFGKYKYKLSKKAQEAKKKQKVILVKEVKLRPKTEEHDYQFKMRHIRRFLSEGNKAKITVIFKGREMAHLHLGEEMLNRIAQEILDDGTIEQSPKQEGRNLTMVVAPKHS
ncbi:MAG: translation initiation factor IF-3 [Candidatus Tectomicrobia bacterium]|uniref:Translation initiation factor IF-3 n=1 Tax=Tectimicrobiota bacterium TaxID=2528274 RepID=A0A933LQ97_UNCTE|nr:translation initiation factor IF-3 [Candidatus Tectomicrobia bacterium]